jgi:polyisoprenoid-binding protein YceI
MKKIILLLWIAICCDCYVGKAQIFLTQAAQVSFFSSTPMENIDATNSKVSSLINTSTDSIFVKIKNSAFVFKSSLMQDHFNENYMETSKYPFANFRGKINGEVNYKREGSYKVTANGKMSIHGVEKMVTLNGTIVVKGTDIILDSEIIIKPVDYKIEIPKLVFQKIAENIKVSIKANYKPYAK